VRDVVATIARYVSIPLRGRVLLSRCQRRWHGRDSVSWTLCVNNQVALVCTLVDEITCFRSLQARMFAELGRAPWNLAWTLVVGIEYPNMTQQSWGIPWMQVRYSTEITPWMEKLVKEASFRYLNPYDLPIPIFGYSWKNK
jgi:hypothetical protein